MKLQASILTAASALLLTTVTYAQVTLTDIGATAPTPGTLDISQLSNNGTGNDQNLNYYWDDGANHPTGPGFPGQTFTTGSNPQGYSVTSLAIKTSGGGGGTPTTNQSFTLAFYQLSDTGLTNATLLATFTATSALTTEGDWMLWTNIGVNLAPNTNYAYGFGRSPGSPGDWELLSTATNQPYTGGQICLIVNGGGLVTYTTIPNTADATFDLGLAYPSAPVPAPPLETPASASTAAAAGQSVTFGASSAGETPISYQWQTDGGTGQSPTNIPGATNINLVVNTANWAVGTYVYDFVASNALGVVTSPTADIVIVPVIMEDLGTNAPTPGANDIAQLSYTQGSYNPGGFNYYTDDGAGHSAWAGQTFTTGSNADGYIMTSLAWKSDGNGSAFGDFQLYDLYIFSVSGTPATTTLLASYQCYGGGNEQDWFKFVGLNVSLGPKSLYAYAFGRDSSATGWENISSSSNSPGLYTGGQVCTIFPPATGSTVTYGPGNQDATFDIGLVGSTSPFTSVPTYTPDVTPVYAQTTVTLNELAAGTPPLSYQWYADNGTGGVTWTAVTGAITTNLVVSTTALTPNSYEYEIVVKNNSAIVTSAPVTLVIVAASEPVIVNDTSPNPDEDYVGETTTFSTTFAGTLPITYQWMANTGSGFKAVANATNDTLVLTNIQSTAAGTYYVSTSNAIGGPVTSTPSTLTVLADPAAPAAGSYGATILADGPLAYWQLNETGSPASGVLPAYDYSGNEFDGVYGEGSSLGVAGPTPSGGFNGFSASTLAVGTTQGGAASAYVKLPSLNIKTNTVTITAWIDPTANQVADAGVVFHRNFNNTDASGLGFGPTLNAAGMAGLGYTWNSNSAATYNYSSGLYPLPDQWSFVALVITPANATIYLYYIDPLTSLPDLYSAVNDVTNETEYFSLGTGDALGTNAIGTDPYSSATRSFAGNIAQVAVFDKALTGSEILAMFSKATGVAAFAPSITTQPQSAGVYSGGDVAFAVAGINGTAPFSYQWQSNGVNIAGATNLSLVLSNVTAANNGTYDVLVKNSVSTTASSNAVLSVVTPVPGSYESAVLKYNPLAFWRLNETNIDPSTGNALAFEDVSGFTGTYQIAAQDGWNGILGPQPTEFPGFPADNTALETFAGTAASYVSASTGTLVASNLTYAMWINPQAAVGNWSGLLMDRGGVGEGLGFGGVVNASGMSELAFTWDQNNTWTNFESGTPPRLFPPMNEWSFVAMVIEPSSGTLYMFNSNGFQSSVDARAMDAEDFGQALHIGDDAAGGTTGGRTFPGMISGVAVFLSALSSNQVLTLYDAGVGKTPPVQPVTMTIAKATAGNLTLSWSAGTLVQATNLAGPWITNTAAVSPLTVTPTNSRMFFEVK
jgi:hypothetical protein